MLSRCPPADKQNNACHNPIEERPGKSFSAAGEENVGVENIEAREVMNQALYVAQVIIGISLPEPDPVIDENLVMRQV